VPLPPFKRSVAFIGGTLILTYLSEILFQYAQSTEYWWLDTHYVNVVYNFLFSIWKTLNLNAIWRGLLSLFSFIYVQGSIAILYLTAYGLRIGATFLSGAATVKTIDDVLPLKYDREKENNSYCGRGSFCTKLRPVPSPFWILNFFGVISDRIFFVWAKDRKTMCWNCSATSSILRILTMFLLPFVLSEIICQQLSVQSKLLSLIADFVSYNVPATAVFDVCRHLIITRKQRFFPWVFNLLSFIICIITLQSLIYNFDFGPSGYMGEVPRVNQCLYFSWLFLWIFN